MSGSDIPGADLRLINLLGLEPSVKRLMIYTQGCFIGGAAMRHAKDISENNAGSRVLLVICDLMDMYFHEPQDRVDLLFGQAVFGDGAAALIVGADPDDDDDDDDDDDTRGECPLFQIVSCAETTIPDTQDYIRAHLKEMGMELFISTDLPRMIGENIKKPLSDAMSPFGISDWNSLFYISHPGSVAILDQVEENLELGKDKLRASRHVLSEYGNMGAASVFFILDEMRKKRVEEGKLTTCEGLDCRVLFSFGSGPYSYRTIRYNMVPHRYGIAYVSEMVNIAYDTVMYRVCIICIVRFTFFSLRLPRPPLIEKETLEISCAAAD